MGIDWYVCRCKKECFPSNDHVSCLICSDYFCFDNCTACEYIKLKNKEIFKDANGYDKNNNDYLICKKCLIVIAKKYLEEGIIIQEHGEHDRD